MQEHHPLSQVIMQETEQQIQVEVPVEDHLQMVQHQEMVVQVDQVSY